MGFGIDFIKMLIYNQSFNWLSHVASLAKKDLVQDEEPAFVKTFIKVTCRLKYLKTAKLQQIYIWMRASAFTPQTANCLPFQYLSRSHMYCYISIGLGF